MPNEEWPHFKNRQFWWPKSVFKAYLYSCHYKVKSTILYIRVIKTLISLTSGYINLWLIKLSILSLTNSDWNFVFWFGPSRSPEWAHLAVVAKHTQGKSVYKHVIAYLNNSNRIFLIFESFIGNLTIIGNGKSWLLL